MTYWLFELADWTINPLNPKPIQHLSLGDANAGGIRIVQDPSGRFVYGLSQIYFPGSVNALHVLNGNLDGTLTETQTLGPIPNVPAGALPQGIAVL